MARNTKNAASVGTSRCTTKLVTNCATSACRLASHPVEIPPLGSGTGTPNEVNQLSSGWSVRNTTAQNIHLVNPPPMANVIVPSRRRLTPAITRDSSAADGASKSRTEIMSLSSCGVAICPIPQIGTYIEKKHSGYRQPASLFSRCGLPGCFAVLYSWTHG